MASVRERAGKRGRTFMALYRDGEGRQRSAGSYKTRKEALKMARLAEAGMPVIKADPAYPGKVRGKETVASYAREWFSGHAMSPHTSYVYDRVLRVHILPALGSRPLTALTTADIRAFFRSLESQGTSHALGRKIKTVLSSMLQTAAEDGLIAVNPVRGVRFQAAPPKRRRALTAAEWLAIRRYLQEPYRLMCDVVMATGARIEEVLGMRPGDVRDGVWTIARTRAEIGGTFHYQERTKTGRTRQVMLPESLASRIREAGPFPEFLLDSFRLLHWYPACQRAGLDWRPAPRDLRRTFATLARSGGADLEAVRIALGHTRIATTDIYLGERAEARTDALLAVQRALGLEAVA